jgi:hypothetical protein
MEIIEFKENVPNVKTGKSMMQIFKHVKVNAKLDKSTLSHSINVFAQIVII